MFFLKFKLNKRKLILFLFIIISLLLISLIFINKNSKIKKNNKINNLEENTEIHKKSIDENSEKIEDENYIKCVEFSPNLEVLEDTMKEDINSFNKNKKKIHKKHLSWIDLLAFLAVEYDGDFKKYKKTDLKNIVKKINSNDDKEIVKNLKLFNYYKEAYGAVLSGFIGINNNNKYGLKVYSPIAKNFSFSHCSDFGAIRTYGYSRPHLGHDLMCETGTPVIAVESGKIEAMGWNQYGGWRIGIRSFDKKRYWYYAHLRKDRPFSANIKIDDEIESGQVIGYVGRTGYSRQENVNNIVRSHLHLGLQLIFDESQKESNNQIWIDLYPLTIFLERNKSKVRRDEKTKEFFKES